MDLDNDEKKATDKIPQIIAIKNSLKVKIKKEVKEIDER